MVWGREFKNGGDGLLAPLQSIPQWVTVIKRAAILSAVSQRT